MPFKPILRFSILFFLFTSVACGVRPPKDEPPQDMLLLIQDALPKIDRFFNHIEDYQTLKEDKWLPERGHFYFEKGDLLTFLQEPWNVNRPSEAPLFCYAGKNGDIIIANDFYVSNGPENRPVFSYDNQTWYKIDGDPNKDLSFIPKVHFSHIQKGRELHFKFDWAIFRGDRPPLSDFSSKNCDVVPLGKDLVLFDSEDREAIQFWDHRVVKIPKGTVVELEMHYSSNFFEFQALYQGKAFFKATEPIHFYRNGWVVSLSFDGNYWGDTFFAYKATAKGSIIGMSENRLRVTQGLDILNKKLEKRQQAKR